MRSEERIFQDKGLLKVRQEGEAVVLEWRSQVDVPMARRFEEAFDEWKYETNHFIIDLNSPGGAIAEGENVIRQIDAMRRTHRIDTRVRAGRACYSMCVPIFLQGEERIAAANARFMFHEPTARDYFTDEEVAQPEFEKRYTTARFVDRYFVNSPMNQTWLDDLLAQWRGRDIFKTARELDEEDAGIVTQLE